MRRAAAMHRPSVPFDLARTRLLCAVVRAFAYAPGRRMSWDQRPEQAPATSTSTDSLAGDWALATAFDSRATSRPFEISNSVC
jgi:hypothetical protein